MTPQIDNIPGLDSKIYLQIEDAIKWFTEQMVFTTKRLPVEQLLMAIDILKHLPAKIQNYINLARVSGGSSSTNQKFSGISVTFLLDNKLTLSIVGKDDNTFDEYFFVVFDDNANVLEKKSIKNNIDDIMNVVVNYIRFINFK